nr:MAG TPA: hypothetical protein [Inoviridae sp.]
MRGGEKLPLAPPSSNTGVERTIRGVRHWQKQIR